MAFKNSHRLRVDPAKESSPNYLDNLPAMKADLATACSIWAAFAVVGVRVGSSGAGRIVRLVRRDDRKRWHSHKVADKGSKR